jgi:hypothetical protein
VRRSFERAAATQAQALLAPMIGRDFDEEVFLAGGAFKPVLKEGHPVRDLDLWVRDRKVRERLTDHLIANGAELVHDFHPYCLKFEREGAEIEVTYQNVKDRPISWVLERFDVAAVSIAATFRAGKVTEMTVLPAALQSFVETRLYLNEGYIDLLEELRSPDVLQSIDRITRFAEAFDMEIPEALCEEFWVVYETIYTREEQEACLDTYLRTTVAYKGRCDLDLLRRANREASEVELLAT